MAIKDIKISGKVRTGAGAGVSGAIVSLLETAADLDGTANGTTITTNSDGTFSFTVEGSTYSLANAWDVKISSESGDSIRYMAWSDEISLKGVDASYMKIRGVGDGDAAPLYFIADQGGDNADIWTFKAADQGDFTFESFISGSSVAQLTIKPNSTVASSSVVFPGILDVNGSVDWDVTDVQVDSSGDIDLVSSNNAAGAIYLHQSTGTSGTIKIHADTGTSVTEGAESINILSDVGGVGIRSTANLAKAINITSDGGTTGSINIFNDQGTSVTEGAESISILSDAGGVGIRSTANLANAVNLTVDGGTTSSMTLFNDQGTSVTEGASSIQLLSDAGGVELKSTANLAKSIKLIADGGTSETIYIQSDQGTSESSIQLLSDAGGIDIDAATGKDVDIAGGTVNLTSSDDAASAIYLRANAGTSETIKIHADQGTGTGSIELLSDAGGIELDAGTDIILDAGGADIFLKDDGTLFGTLNNNSGELLIKSSSSGTTAATFSGANVTFAGTVDATTDFTIGDTVITDGVITDSTGLQLAANLDIDGTADISGDLTLSGGADGALQFTNAGENSIKIPDNQASALIIEQADNAYITFVTTNSSEAITVAKATTFSAGIANSGTIAAGTWNGTAIASGYIAADAITGAKIADDAIDSEHYTDGSIDTAHLAADAVTGAKIADDAINSEHYTDGSIDTAHIADDQVTLAKMAGLARGKLIYGDSSGNPAALAVGNANEVLTHDGTDLAWAAASGGGDYESTIGAGGSTSLTGSKRYIIAPGTTMTGAVTLSNADTHLRIGAGTDFDGQVLTISGAGCSVVCENGVTLDGVVISGAGCSFDGGGWDTLSNGGTSRHGMDVTGVRCEVRNVALQTTAGAGNNHKSFYASDAANYARIENVRIIDSDKAGFDCRGESVKIIGCVIDDSDEEGVYFGGNRCTYMGNYSESGSTGISLDGNDHVVIGNIVKSIGAGSAVTVNNDNHLVVANRLVSAINENSTNSMVATNEIVAFASD